MLNVNFFQCLFVGLNGCLHKKDSMQLRLEHSSPGWWLFRTPPPLSGAAVLCIPFLQVAQQWVEKAAVPTLVWALT